MSGGSGEFDFDERDWKKFKFNPVLTDTTAPTRVIIAIGRAQRGGMQELQSQANFNDLDYPPFVCKPFLNGHFHTFKGKYLKETFRQIEKDGVKYEVCPFSPGHEWMSTFEWARFEGEKFIAHQSPVYPEHALPNWEQRLVDNKFPLLEEWKLGVGVVPKDFHRDTPEGEVKYAYGKSYVLVESPFHLTSSKQLDFYKMMVMYRHAHQIELQKPHVQFVAAGRNIAGFPKLRKVPERFTGGNDISYYESEGIMSGASQPHPHSQIFSMNFVPPKINQELEHVEKYVGKWKKSPYENLINNDSQFTIQESRNFVLIADPVPNFSGTLTVVSRKQQEITEITSDNELKEFSGMLQLAQMLIDVRYDFPPCNMYFEQVFKDLKKDYPNTKMRVKFAPRGNVHGVLELSADVIGITSNPSVVAEDMRQLKPALFEKYRTPLFSCIR